MSTTNLDNINIILVGLVFNSPENDPSSCRYLGCNRKAISIIDYINLFNVIGTTFGIEDGAPNFNIPDLRGMFIRGSWIMSAYKIAGVFIPTTTRLFGTTHTLQKYNRARVLRHPSL